MDRQEWLLKRNCSLTPRQTLAAFVVLCGLPFGVALAFLFLHGTWIVLAFAAMEMTAVAAAFLHYARHAADREHLELADGSLLVEQFSAGSVRQIRLDACWTRVHQPFDGHGMIELEARGVKVEVGRYATEARRRQLAQELRTMLRGYRVI
jgi:uncharacterized membrane protein